MKKAKKPLSLIFGLGAMPIVGAAIFYSVAQAEEQPYCYMSESSGQVRDLRDLCNRDNHEQKSGFMESAKKFFQRGSEFDAQGQNQQAIIEYTRAIELDPNYAEAYFYRGNSLALEGQPLKGIEDLKKAAVILESIGKPEWAAAIRQHEEIIRQGIRDGEF